MTARIAGRELRTLWATPVPYVVGALFNATLGLLFVNQLEARQQALSQPLFPIAGFLLIALVPLLTMRTVADEARSGNLDLLRTVPVGARAFVAGKFVAVWLTTVAVVAPAGILVLVLSRFGDPDAGPIVTGFVGLAALAAGLCGLGVATSACTASQPVAAVTAFFSALALWFAHVGSDAAVTGTLLARFSFSERLRDLAGGLLDIGDLAFFVAVAIGGLTVATVAVESRRLR